MTYEELKEIRALVWEMVENHRRAYTILTAGHVSALIKECYRAVRFYLHFDNWHTPQYNPDQLYRVISNTVQKML